MIDIILINIPLIETSGPLLAPALLKSSLKAQNFSVKTIDFNIRFFNNNYTTEIDYFFRTNEGNDETRQTAESLVSTWVDETLAFNPRWIGISVFTYQCRIAAEIFARLAKIKNPDIKIVLGGSGIGEGGINGVNVFTKKLRQQGIIDHFVMSEGEVSLVKLLQDDLNYPGINSDAYQQIKDIDSLPFPDFDDYDFSQYEEKNRRLPIYGSRGCVRRCTFCDIHQHWKYNYRSGKSIADEMISQSAKYGMYDFYFMDSLVNGSLKEFRQFLRYMADYNTNASDDKKITWMGYYIVRDRSAEGKDHWELMEKSGAKKLIIGIESGSEKVRYEMDKKFKNSDVDYLVNKLYKHNITCQFLMIFGYPTETEKDYEDSLDFIRRYKKFAGTAISSITISNTLGILPGTPLYNNLDKLDIILDPKHENNWICKTNPELTLTERIRRVMEARQLVTDLGFENYTPDDLLVFLEENVKKFNSRLKLLDRVFTLKQI